MPFPFRITDIPPSYYIYTLMVGTFLYKYRSYALHYYLHRERIEEEKQDGLLTEEDAYEKAIKSNDIHRIRKTGELQQNATTAYACPSFSSRIQRSVGGQRDRHGLLRILL